MGNSNTKAIGADDEVNLNHFRLLRVVGKGAFGKVRIVEHKGSGLSFALKYIRKDEIVRTESVRNIIRERRMLEHLNHPFLCNLRYSFQDVEYMYLVVDLMTGGDLRFHISRKAFTEDTIKFWMAQLACALRYIHSQGIVHRDLKPDNVLLDNEGHVHLADFNVASDFRPSKPLTSKSGTLAYLAPEVFRGNGYLSEVDWWSLGVTFYECIYAKRPFDGKTQEALADSICAGNPKYYATKPPVSMPCLLAMSSLLERDRRKRIGATGFDTFAQSPFFQQIDFNALERKEIQPIFVPSSEKTNFDATYDLEELLLEEAPLEARARKQKPRAELRNDASERERREDDMYKMIETMFEPFDYTEATYDMDAATAVAGRVPEEHVELINSPSSARSHPHSGSGSPNASPHLGPDLSPSRTKGDENFPNMADMQSALPHAPSSPRPHSASQSFSRPLPPKDRQHIPQHPPPQLHRPRPPHRVSSKSGGVQMALDDSGQWSAVSDQNSHLSSDGEQYSSKPEKGMLGFLSRKKGRDRSPRPKDPAILGKVGARQIINKD